MRTEAISMGLPDWLRKPRHIEFGLGLTKFDNSLLLRRFSAS
jgi:hypothetical protein